MCKKVRVHAATVSSHKDANGIGHKPVLINFHWDMELLDGVAKISKIFA